MKIIEGNNKRTRFFGFRLSHKYAHYAEGESAADKAHFCAPTLLNITEWNEKRLAHIACIASTSVLKKLCQLHEDGSRKIGRYSWSLFEYSEISLN
jgi:hypothetical protein